MKRIALLAASMLTALSPLSAAAATRTAKLPSATAVTTALSGSNVADLGPGATRGPNANYGLSGIQVEGLAASTAKGGLIVAFRANTEANALQSNTIQVSVANNAQGFAGPSVTHQAILIGSQVAVNGGPSTIVAAQFSAADAKKLGGLTAQNVISYGTIIQNPTYVSGPNNTTIPGPAQPNYYINAGGNAGWNFGPAN